MYRLEREDFVKNPYISLWATLGFQAGFINAFGFLACGRFVSHVTGFGTQIGGAFASGKLLLAIELLGFPLAFIAGSFFSALFTSARLERQKVPLYGLITGILPAVITLLLVLGMFGQFGEFGKNFDQVRELTLLFLLSFVCGMQNGCFATMTKGQIRTTHLTGISTDIGTDLARVWFGKLAPKEFELTRRTNICRVATFLAFTSGSIFSVLLSQRLEFMALVIPCVTSICVFFAVGKIHRMLDRRFHVNKYREMRRKGAEKSNSQRAPHELSTA